MQKGIKHFTLECKKRLILVGLWERITIGKQFSSERSASPRENFCKFRCTILCILKFNCKPQNNDNLICNFVTFKALSINLEGRGQLANPGDLCPSPAPVTFAYRIFYEIYMCLNEWLCFIFTGKLFLVTLGVKGLCDNWRNTYYFEIECWMPGVFCT